MSYWAVIPDETPTAPNLPVNPDRDYCKRCGAAKDLTPARVGGQPMLVCDECRQTLQRRAARGGPEVVLMNNWTFPGP